MKKIIKFLRNPKLTGTIFKYYAIIFIYIFVWIIFAESIMENLFDEIIFLLVFLVGLIIWIFTARFVINLILKKIFSEKKFLKQLDMHYIQTQPMFEKYLFFRKAILLNVLEVYYVSNKNGEIYYKVYLKEMLPNKYVVENYKKEEVATITMSLLSGINLSSKIILNNGKEITFKRKVKDGQCVWNMDGVEHIIDSSNVYTQFNKIMIDNNIIGEIDQTILPEGWAIGNYDLIINDENMELIIVALTMCILYHSNYYRHLTSD